MYLFSETLRAVVKNYFTVTAFFKNFLRIKL